MVNRALLLLAACSLWAAEDQKPEPAPAGGRSTVESVKTRRVRLGGITVGAGYAHYSGPYYRGPYYYGYDPWMWGPFYPYYAFSPWFYHPYYGTGFARGPNMGEIRLRTPNKEDQVMLDGAYAGKAGDLKSMWLDPGAYQFEVRQDSRTAFSRKIYVLSGKTLRIDVKEATP